MTEVFKTEVDEFDLHELLDRVHVVSCLFDDIVIEHHAARQLPEFKQAIARVEDALGDLYMAVGRRRYQNEIVKAKEEL